MLVQMVTEKLVAMMVKGMEAFVEAAEAIAKAAEAAQVPVVE